MTDLLIIGGGPAGLTAAICACRAGRTVVVCEREGVGGQIAHAHRVDNYPGLPGVSGLELSELMYTQATQAGAAVELTEVQAVTRGTDGLYTASTTLGSMAARAVIFAGGAQPRRLALEGEAELTGRGVSYCALCDGAFYRGQDVAVVGGGSAAFSEALYLATLCRTVSLIHRREGFRAEAALIAAARQVPNLRLLTPCTVTELLHDGDGLTGLTLTHAKTGAEKHLAVTGLFVALGREPDCWPVSRLVSLDERGYIPAQEDCCTQLPGLFVAGDCRAKQVRQLTTAAADGTTAAWAACAWLDRGGAGG